MLLLQCVTAGYGKRTVIREATAEAGSEVVALVGVNGAGKSTLFRVLAGLLPIRTGRVDIEPASTRIGYAPQFTPRVSSLSVDEALRYLAALRGQRSGRIQSAVRAATELTGIEQSCHLRLSELSGGLAKRFSIAQALLGDPQLMLLDEPTSGLDPIQRLAVTELITRLAADRTIIFSTHDMQEAQDLANSYWHLAQDGRISQGSIDDDAVPHLLRLMKDAT